MRPLLCWAVAALPMICLALPNPAQAAGVGWFQWGTEGSYVHQISHLLIMGAMLYFIFEIRRSGLQYSRGFRRLSWACWLLAIWNLDAIIGHTIEWSLLNPVITGTGLNRWLLMEDWHTWLFYITKMDHFLLLIPAFYLFYRSFQAFVQDTQNQRS